MNIKKHIPNFLTCCNLLCGCVGIIAISYHDCIVASYCIFIACLFDFLDGFAARGLKVSSSIGKDLDSLSDMVSFGLLPGLIMFELMSRGNIGVEMLFTNNSWMLPVPEVAQSEIMRNIKLFGLIPFLAFIIPVFSALRLAKFNNDTRQSERFIGLPTPANAIFISGVALIYDNISFEGDDFFAQYFFIIPSFLFLLTIFLSYLLIAELPLIALKFKNFGWPDNKMRYLLIITSLILFLTLNFTAIPIIIILYIILSVIDNKLIGAKSKQY
jgi:CDP-diacylglycerol--serine O-phosphatidyltransferase